jgi:hypothetical protein
MPYVDNSFSFLKITYKHLEYANVFYVEWRFASCFWSGLWSGESAGLSALSCLVFLAVVWNNPDCTISLGLLAAVPVQNIVVTHYL